MSIIEIWSEMACKCKILKSCKSCKSYKSIANKLPWSYMLAKVPRSDTEGSIKLALFIAIVPIQ